MRRTACVKHVNVAVMVRIRDTATAAAGGAAFTIGESRWLRDDD